MSFARHNRRSPYGDFQAAPTGLHSNLIEAAKVTFAIATLADGFLTTIPGAFRDANFLIAFTSKRRQGSHGSFSRHDGLVRMWPRSSGWGNEADRTDQDSRTSFPDKISAQTDIFWRAKKLSLYGAPPQRPGASGGLTKWAGARPKLIVRPPRIG